MNAAKVGVTIYRARSEAKGTFLGRRAAREGLMVTGCGIARAVDTSSGQGLKEASAESCPLNPPGTRKVHLLTHFFPPRAGPSPVTH